ncbi:hypothetical protein EKK58_12265 [Candidatus Dependentiae bacterium]|nr:MAG: hypothetical protein EKK58_12265 [Candidatus Dependentiae bacterium]
MSGFFSTFMIDITGGAVLDVDALLAAAAPSGASIVSSINAQLGSTTWQGGGSGTPAWGAIVGTLSSQSDLQTALDGKAASSHTHTLSQISDITVTSDMVSIPKGIRPGLYDDHGTPPVGTIFESVNDGHLYWVHRDGSVHLLCDSGGYGTDTNWGDIAGTLSDQTDLQAALNAKQPLDATLTAMAGVATGAGSIILFTGDDTCTVQGFGPPAQALGNCSDYSSARAVLGLAIGTNVQAYDADLQAIASLSSAADTAVYYTGAGTAALMTVTSAARALLDDPNAATMRTTLGLTIGANVQGYSGMLQNIANCPQPFDQFIYYDSSGIAVRTGITTAGRNLLDDANAAAMLTTLGAAPKSQPPIGGNRYFSSYPGQVASFLNVLANYMYYCPIAIPNGITATRIGINVVTAAAGSIRLGFYNDVNGAPSGAPLLDAGTVNTSTTGEKEITISLALSPGMYWLAFVSNVALQITAEAMNAGVNTFNFGTLTGAGNAITCANHAFTFGALPSVGTLNWWDTKFPPRIWIRNP